jgi:pimeloyl-ACP methyl ester carboxylesterase
VDLSVVKAGSGPGLLLIHGSLLNSSISWGAVLAKFAEHFTVYAMDRRGRAPSGDAKEYSLSIEANDIVRVVEAIGGPLTVLGHSYGALATMEAQERWSGVERVILYEPPVALTPRGPAMEERLATMEQALKAGNRPEVATIFLRDAVGVPPERIPGFPSSPFWPVVLEIAPTLPRESREVNIYRDWGARLARWKIPTAMLVGTETIQNLQESAQFVCKSIPRCRLVVLPGQAHSAMMEAPEMFVARVREIISGKIGGQSSGPIAMQEA